MSFLAKLKQYLPSAKAPRYSKTSIHLRRRGDYWNLFHYPSLKLIARYTSKETAQSAKVWAEKNQAAVLTWVSATPVAQSHACAYVKTRSLGVLIKLTHELDVDNKELEAKLEQLKAAAAGLNLVANPKPPRENPHPKKKTL